MFHRPHIDRPRALAKRYSQEKDVQNIAVRSASRVGRGDNQEFQVLGEDEENEDDEEMRHVRAVDGWVFELERDTATISGRKRTSF